MAKYTEAQKRSAEKYLSQFEKITLRVKPDEKREIERKAIESGKSVNQYIKDRILGE